ncbi:MAG TPA: hypothetical protein VFS90_18905 [Pyrinomonadaceae bacterium]|nr:hypothetical protein [Pyrinomonadaceae bacterium]
MLLDRFRAAGIPMRYKLGDGIVHTKMLLLAGTCTVRVKAHGQTSNAGTMRIRT